jgi:polysaccharide export outer membrane protein
MKLFNIKIYLGCIFLILFASCSTKRFIYFYEEGQSITDTNRYKPIISSDYLIQPNDILYIEFHSTLTDAEKYFNFSSQNNGENTQISPSGLYVSGYVVSDSGNITIPVIGNIQVSNLNLRDIEKSIVNEGRKYINDVIVKVKMLSFKITFVGEFGTPGEKYFYTDKVNLMDALAAAGEVTYYGDRKNLRILRQTTDGIESFKINLNDKELLNSKHFYLKPNDIIYAEPLRRKVLSTYLSDYSLILVALTSTVALVTLVISAK